MLQQHMNCIVCSRRNHSLGHHGFCGLKKSGEKKRKKRMRPKFNLLDHVCNSRTDLLCALSTKGGFQALHQGVEKREFRLKIASKEGGGDALQSVLLIPGVFQQAPCPVEALERHSSGLWDWGSPFRSKTGGEIGDLFPQVLQRGGANP